MEKRSLPDEIRVLVERLRVQDNRATAEPLYCVEKKARVYGIEPGYADDLKVWRAEDWVINSPEDFIDEVKLQLEQGDLGAEQVGDFEDFEDFEDLIRAAWKNGDEVMTPDGETLEVCWYLERWEFVTAHFTEAAAQEYLESNKHHFPHGARVFVTSQYRCHEWNAVREFLMQLADEESPK